jgi:hypothetical protein
MSQRLVNFINSGAFTKALVQRSRSDGFGNMRIDGNEPVEHSGILAVLVPDESDNFYRFAMPHSQPFSGYMYAKKGDGGMVGW